MRVLLLAIIALVVATAGFARSPSGAGHLSGAQIRQTLIGKTLSGVDKGESYSESLNPDGTIAGHSASGDYSGRWRITGNQICFFYEEETKGGKWDCTGARLQGAQVTWDDGTTAMVNDGPGAAPAGEVSQKYHHAAVQTYHQPAAQTYHRSAVQPYRHPAVQTYPDPAMQAYPDPAMQAYPYPAMQAYPYAVVPAGCAPRGLFGGLFGWGGNSGCCCCCR
jgi:hypothetical protein